MKHVLTAMLILLLLTACILVHGYTGRAVSLIGVRGNDKSKFFKY